MIVLTFTKCHIIKFGVKIMKNPDETVGVIKEIDSLGRIVIPKEFRERLMLNKEVEVLITESGVIIRNSKFKLVETTNSKIKDNQQKNGSN